MRGRHILAALLLCGLAAPARAAEHKADVVVYGATAGGVVAAVAVTREGKSVILLEPDKHVGGMFTGGLGATDTGNRAGIGGYSREVFNRIRAHYVTKYGKDAKQVKDCSDGFRFEPHVATLVLKGLMKEAKVEPRFDHRLDKVTRSKDDGKTSAISITSITTTNGDTFVAPVYIDATYEGDLMALAGVKYHVGRESSDTYGESLAGVQKFSRFHQWPVKVNGRDARDKLLPLIQGGPDFLGKPGQGDKKVQAYNFRLCMTNRKGNIVPWPRPSDYDASRYELLARYLKANPTVQMGQLMNPVRMPNDKTDTNNNGPLSTDHIGANWLYPDGSPEVRARIWHDHVHYTQGFFWFLAHDPRVPPALQKEINRWGLAKDEFVDNGNWPHQLYIREARRMVGAHVMTQRDIMTDRTKDDAIGVGSYNTDSHHVQRVIRADGTVLNEGDFQVGLSPYAIPYRALTPKANECANLLVPVCCSTSHVAYGTVRMEPVFMILGQAAGVAAAMAADGKTSVQKVPVAQLVEKLKKQKAVLTPTGLPGRSGKAGLDPAKMAGVVVDDTQARLTGEWRRSSATTPYVGAGYLHDGDADKGKLAARFVPRLKAGRYEVRLYHAPTTNRAANAVVLIHSKAGTRRMTVDQRKSMKTGGLLLGAFDFDDGEAGWVEVRNEGTTGHVIADAVQFVPVK